MIRSPIPWTIRLTLCSVVALTKAMPVAAQDFPNDAQVQEAFGIAYDHFGLMEYCAAKGYSTTGDVANARKSVDALTRGINVTGAARAQEAIGQRGEIVGPQIIGLIDPDNPAHPEIVSAGKTMSLAVNARSQNTTERVLCGQMAAQVAPLP